MSTPFDHFNVNESRSVHETVPSFSPDFKYYISGKQNASMNGKTIPPSTDLLPQLKLTGSQPESSLSSKSESDNSRSPQTGIDSPDKVSQYRRIIKELKELVFTPLATERAEAKIRQPASPPLFDFHQPVDELIKNGSFMGWSWME